MKKTVLALTTIAALALSACGGDSGGGLSDDDQKAAENLAKDFKEQGDSTTASVSDEDAKCIAEETVASVGVDQLQEYGLLDENLKVDKQFDEVKMSTADAEAAADSFVGCVDVEALIREGFAAQIEGQPQEVKDCIDEALSEETVRDFLVAEFAGAGEEAQQKLFEPLAKCAQKAMGGPPSG